jgi:hypothetical protein
MIHDVNLLRLHTCKVPQQVDASTSRRPVPQDGLYLKTACHPFCIKMTGCMHGFPWVLAVVAFAPQPTSNVSIVHTSTSQVHQLSVPRARDAKSAILPAMNTLAACMASPGDRVLAVIAPHPTSNVKIQVQRSHFHATSHRATLLLCVVDIYA